MFTLLAALTGLAIIDALDVLLVAVTAMVILDSRLARRSPVPGALSFLGGVFAVTATFGLLTVLGVGWLTEVFDFRITPTQRYWAQLVVGVVLLILGSLRLSSSGPGLPDWAVRARRRPAMLAGLGVVVGLGQAPTAVPYLAGLAMLATRDPRPSLWPLIIVAYCLLALLPPLLILLASLSRSARSRQFQRALLRGLNRFGPPAVRIIFLVGGAGLIIDALRHYAVLW